MPTCQSEQAKPCSAFDGMKKKFRCHIELENLGNNTIQLTGTPHYAFLEFYYNVSTGQDPDDICNDLEPPEVDTREITDEDAREITDEDMREMTDEDTMGMPQPEVVGNLEHMAPTQVQATSALEDVSKILYPQSKNGLGHSDPHINMFIRTRLEGMRATLNFYTNKNSQTFDNWSGSSMQAAVSHGRGTHCAKQLRKLTRQFIKDRTVLPVNPYGHWRKSMLANEDLTNEIGIYLLSIPNGISAQKLLEFINSDDFQSRHGIEKKITVQTARRYLQGLGYRYTEPKKGQYVDGHEREDVVFYREQVFLPQWHDIEHLMVSWDENNFPEFRPRLAGRRVIAWFHDESIFYAHDRRRKAWYHKDAPAKPYAKGEGASIMVSDFVSADLGWLQSPDGSQSARRIFKPGKNREGYFTNEDIRAQVHEAMDILTEFYPSYDHVLIYDNAPTHLKCKEDALSARKMPKNTPKPGHNWGIEVSVHDPLTGKIIYKPDGSPVKTKIRMGDAHFSDGQPQPLYFPEGHPRAGVFKGMAIILEECGFGDMSKVRAECKNFKCAPPAVDCCCCQILYNQPDFTNIEPILTIVCKSRGFRVLFLPKFHCELNPIEQCWGYAKRIYRLNPESSREDVLEKNMLMALKAVPLQSIHKFSNRSCHFIDAYTKGLSGSQAAWAARQYQGHRVLPTTIMEGLDTQGGV